MFRRYTSLFLLVLLIGTFVFVAPTFAAERLSEHEVLDRIQEPEPRIKIPGLDFSPPEITGTKERPTEDREVVLHVHFLGDYIAALYKFGVVVISVIAVLMFIGAGLRWSASMGNATAIAAAKTRMVKATIALLLTFGSYTVLYTANPKLVEFQSLSVLFTPEDLDTVAELNKHNEDVGGPDCNPKKDGIFCKIKRKGPPKIDCPQDTAANNEACRKECVENLPDEKKSKPIGLSYGKFNTKPYPDGYMGYLDCGHNRGKRSRLDVNTIVIHEGRTKVSPKFWWAKQQRGHGAIASHFLIDQAGTIYQLMDIEFVGVHAKGNATSIGIDLDAGCTTTNINYDYVVANCSYSEAQYASLRTLIKHLRSVVGGAAVVGHCEQFPPGGGGHSDPRMFDWAKIGESRAAHKKGICSYLWGYEMGKGKHVPVVSDNQKELDFIKEAKAAKVREEAEDAQARYDAERRRQQEQGS